MSRVRFVAGLRNSQLWNDGQFSTLLMKAYRPPRELTWLSGLGLLGVTLVFGFSGYLLPWDELSFFCDAGRITEMEKTPLLGEWLGNLLRGGADVTTDTIGRFYALHVSVLPLVLAGIVFVHLLFIQMFHDARRQFFSQAEQEDGRLL
jgi:cytochrome b6